MHKAKRVLLLITSCFVLNPGTRYAGNDLSIKHAWISEAPPTVSILAAYLDIENNSENDIRLLSVSSPDFSHIEIHRSLEKNGIATMEKQENLNVVAGDITRLQPGGYHLMLFNPAKPLHAGDKTQMEFNFTAGNHIIIEVLVKKRSGHEHHH